MDSKTRLTLIKAGAIISLIVGIIYCLTIFGAVLGVFNIIAYSKLKQIYDRPVEEAIKEVNNSNGFGWSIYILISCFPWGLFSFLPYLLKENNTSTNNDSSNNQ